MTTDRQLQSYNQACIDQDLQDRYDGYSSEPASPSQTTVKCDCGDRSRWANAKDIWFPDKGLVKLSDAQDHGDSVTFYSMWGIVEITEGYATLYKNCFRHIKRK